MTKKMSEAMVNTLYAVKERFYNSNDADMRTVNALIKRGYIRMTLGGPEYICGLE